MATAAKQAAFVGTNVLVHATCAESPQHAAAALIALAADDWLRLYAISQIPGELQACPLNRAG